MHLSDAQRLVLEYKFFEPAFYHTDVPDWGTSLVHCLALGDDVHELRPCADVVDFAGEAASGAATAAANASQSAATAIVGRLGRSGAESGSETAPEAGRPTGSASPAETDAPVGSEPTADSGITPDEH